MDLGGVVPVQIKRAVDALIQQKGTTAANGQVIMAA